MAAIANAITALGATTELKRTKRSIEAITGLSHDAVARAFRQDKDDPSVWHLNERFEALRNAETDQRSKLERERDDLRAELGNAKARIAELEDSVRSHAQVIFALQLELDQRPEHGATVSRIRRQRPHT